MLVFLIRVQTEGKWLAVQLDSTDRGAQANCGAKFDGAFCGPRNSSRFQGDPFRGSCVAELNLVVADAQIVDAERIPIRRQVRSKGYGRSLRVGCETKHAAQQRAYDHGGGPNLVRRTRGQR